MIIVTNFNSYKNALTGIIKKNETEKQEQQRAALAQFDLIEMSFNSSQGIGVSVSESSKEVSDHS